jgi:uncharacterized protein (TIGR03067 family)
MKHLFSLTMALMLLGCSSSRNAAKNLSPLNGQWTPVQQEMGGKALPADYFKTQKLVIQDSVYTLSAESIDKGILRYKNGQMDIYGKEGVNQGKHFTALYKLEHDQLTIVYNLKGDTYPLGFDTKSSPLLFLSVFRKN